MSLSNKKNGHIFGGLVGWVTIVVLIALLGAALHSSQRSSAVGSGAVGPADDPDEEANGLPVALAPTATNTVAPSYTPTGPPTDTPTSEPTATERATATQMATAVIEAANTPTLTPPPIPTDTPTATPPTLGALPTPPSGLSWTLRVPILMYHYISIPPEDADIYRVDLSVHPDNFRAQMAYLAENDYTTVDLYDLSRAITNQGELPEKPVIITIDDGYLDNYENAFPILQEFGHTATIFVITDLVDREHPGYATWPMLKEMAEAGMRIEPHSKTHTNLNGRTRDLLIWEILGSQQTVAYHIGYTPRYFAYPGGRYDQLTLEIMEELDFWGAVTTMGGRWNGFDNRYEWRRMRVRYTTSLPEFIDLIHPGNTRGGKALDGSSGPGP